MKTIRNVLACCGFLFASCAYSQDALTKDTIIQMSKAGLPEDVIVSKIKAEAQPPKLSTDDLISLKSAGVSDGVIRALVVGAGPKPDPPAANGTTTAAHTQAISSFRSGPIRIEDIVFRRTKLADAKGKEADANLIFRVDARLIELRVANRSVAEIPYGSVDKMSYDYTKHHRIKEGAVVMVASLGAGAIVMLTKSKSHYLEVDYHEGTAPSALVLRLDKKEYKEVLRTARDQTGKDIEFQKDAKL